jgi:hypothetical protein
VQTLPWSIITGPQTPRIYENAQLQLLPHQSSILSASPPRRAPVTAMHFSKILVSFTALMSAAIAAPYPTPTDGSVSYPTSIIRPPRIRPAAQIHFAFITDGYHRSHRRPLLPPKLGSHPPQPFLVLYISFRLLHRARRGLQLAILAGVDQRFVSLHVHQSFSPLIGKQFLRGGRHLCLNVSRVGSLVGLLGEG